MVIFLYIQILLFLNIELVNGQKISYGEMDSGGPQIEKPQVATETIEDLTRLSRTQFYSEIKESLVKGLIPELKQGIPVRSVEFDSEQGSDGLLPFCRHSGDQKVVSLMQSPQRKADMMRLLLEAFETHTQIDYGIFMDHQPVPCPVCHGEGEIDQAMYEVLYDLQKMTHLQESNWGRNKMMRLLIEADDVHMQAASQIRASETLHDHFAECCICHGKGEIEQILDELIHEIQLKLQSDGDGDHRSKGDQQKEMRCQSKPPNIWYHWGRWGPSWAPLHVSQQIIHFESLCKGFCRCLSDGRILVLSDFAISSC